MNTNAFGPEQGQLTRLIERAFDGDSSARDEVLPHLYDELRVIAHAMRRRHGADDTLNTTALVHEAYVKMVGNGSFRGGSRGAFFALAAKVMRSVIVDHVRGRNADKRGGDWNRAFLDHAAAAISASGVDVVVLDEALERLSDLDQRKARLVELRFFAGLSNEESASVLGVSIPTVERDWRMARAWLHSELAEG